MNHVSFAKVRLSSRFAAALLVALAGCFSSTIPPVPCASTAGCPTGQSCDLAAGTCTPSVSTCTESQIVCGGTCYDATACLSCTNGQCISSAGSASTAVTADKDGVVADGASKVTFTVLVQDSGMHHLAGVAVSVSASGTNNTLTPGAGTTDANGAFTFTLATTTAEAKTVTVTVGSGAAQFTKTLVANYVAGPPVAAKSTISATPTTITSSSGASSSAVTVVLADQFGNLCSGVAVAFFSAGGGSFASSSAVTDAHGTATASFSSSAAGSMQVGAHVGPSGSPGAFTLTEPIAITVNPSAPDSQKSTLSADTNNVVADGTAKITYSVKLKDAAGNPVPLYAFSISATGANGTLSANSGSTNALGAASFTLASTSAGTQTVSINVQLAPGALGFSKSVTSTFIAGAPSSTRSTLTSDKTSAAADGASPINLTATVVDANGNPIAGASVQFKSDGTSLGAAATANASGVASAVYSSISAGAKAITAEVSAAGPSLFTLGGLTVQFTGGSPNSSATTFTADSNYVVADNTSVISYTLTVRDANQNPIQSASVSVVALGSNNTLSSASGLADANGVFAFTLRTKTAEAKSLTATVQSSAGPFTKVLTSTFVAGPPVQAASGLSGPSTPTSADGTATALLLVTAVDQYGNGVPANLYTVTSGTTTNGVPPDVFGNWTVQAGTWTNTISSTKANANDVVNAKVSYGGQSFNLSTNISFTAGAASQGSSSISATATSLSTDATTPITITAKFADANANPIVSGSVSVTASGASNTLAFPSGNATDATGTFKVAIISTKAQSEQVLVKQGPVALSIGITFSPGSPTAGSFSCAPTAGGTVYADGIQTYTCTLGLADKSGNAISGFGASLSSMGPQTNFSAATGTASGSTYSSTVASYIPQTENIFATLSLGSTSIAPTPVSLTFANNPWKPANSGMNGGRFNAIAIDPTNSASVWVGGRDSLWNTTNNGTSWTQVSNLHGYVGGIVVDASSVYVAISALDGSPGFYKSNDRGQTWLPGKGTPINDTPTLLKQDPKAPSTLYLGGTYLWRSVDSGANWTQIGAAANFSNVSDIEFDTTAGHVYLVARNGGPFYSTDSGATFTSINGNLGDTTGGAVIGVVVTGFSVDTKTTLYYVKNSGPNSGVWSSSPGGNWTGGISWPIPSTNTLVIAGNNWYVGGTNSVAMSGVARSTNGGSWSSGYVTPFSNTTTAIAVDPNNSSVVWEITNGGSAAGPGIYRSIDSGATWTNPISGLTASPTYALAIAPSNHSQLYSDTNAASVTTNGGATWTAATNLSPGSALAALAVDAVNAGTAYFGFDYSSLYVTTNSGSSWNRNPGSSFAFPAQMIADPINAGRLYVEDTSNATYWISNNAASSFSQLNSAPPYNANGLAIASQAPAVMYVATSNGVYKTTSAGTAVAIFTLANATPASAIGVDPANNSRVYAGTTGGGAILSTDAGATWSPLSHGLPVLGGAQAISSFAFDTSTTPSTPYASNQNAVFKYVNGTWVNVSVGLPVWPTSDSLGQLVIDPVNPQTLYIGTGHGVYKTTTGGQ